LVTAAAALVFQAVKYFIHKDIVLFIVAVLLLVLAGFMVYEVSKVILPFFLQRKDAKH
jgi:zinc transporter ZupT